MPEQTVPCVLYESPGAQNTPRTLQIAKERAKQLGVKHVLVASTSGATGALAAEAFQGQPVVVVAHSMGFAATNKQELLPEHAERIRELGGQIVVATHALGGVGRAIRRKLSTYQSEEIVAFTLRSLGQGLKVACEITVMAVDAGLVPSGAEVIAIAGTGKGADTAAVILSANAQDFFDLRVLEVLCKPRIPR